VRHFRERPRQCTPVIACPCVCPQVAAQITQAAAADEGEGGSLVRADSGSLDDDEGDDLDMDMELDFDSDGLPGSGKGTPQKRQRRRVVVEPRDANGRLYTAAEIRRMKRCGALPAILVLTA